MKLIDAIYEELKKANRSMTAKELADAVLASGQWQTTGKTPDASIGAKIYSDIKENGEQSRFVKVSKGLFGLAPIGPQARIEQPDLLEPEVKGEEPKKQPKEKTATGVEPPTKSILYAPALAILKAATGVALGASEIRNRIVEQYPDLEWQHSQGAVRAMLMGVDGKKNSLISRVEGSRPPRFYFRGECGSVQPTSTPEEIIDKAVKAADGQLKAELLEHIRKMDDSVFEELVNQLIERLGFGNHITTPRSHDHGIDGMIYGDSLGLNVVGVQSKHYTTRNVERDEIDKFIGALEGRNGVFVTTSAFSSGARAKAEHTGSNSHIALIDGQRLVDLMVEKRLGVQEHRSFSLYRIDKDFFEELEG